ncbi:hypothetical protein ENUP19_0047G0015 [Entamoeba nuttalli]|uniref:Rho guanine nucleotide exchange factor, putative n=2 Tax=Entamoeba nuttalli TaxID=412467 RepID=K2H7Q8_ENTNP|nr:Rho guanine nucleotide exchange factor, putative [Entamoeba nuttalli P19]EKE42622.1 Rho guanine nucleotide exchange factor, putative [Entamoeba nuttalli P19]|eukprot:XP_008855057.1 Rho guanine nucleotide exchange factor, putative [Entamoeba nuttalli P19]
MRCSTIADPKESAHRTHIVDEIYATEESYVNSLEQCITSYQQPLMNDNPPIIDGRDVMTMFLHFHEIIAVNSMLMEKLKEFKKRGTLYTNTGGAFIKFVPFLKSYTQYATNQDNCLQVLKRLDHDPRCAKRLEELRTNIKTTNQLDLRSYLIMPVQRLPRYVLLFTDLIKHTPEKFPDYSRLLKVSSEIQKVTVLVNQCIVQGEKLRKLVEISNTIDFPGGDLTVGRKLIRDGILNKQCRKAPKPRYFVLCTDILFYTRPKKREVNVIVKLIEADIRDNDSLRFDIFSPEKSFSIIAANEQEKSDWVKDLKDAIDQCKSNSVLLKTPRDRKIEHKLVMKPVFVPDDQVKECMSCKKEFGVVRRKHHCRFCGSCICSDCSRNKVKNGNSYERTCDICFKRMCAENKDIISTQEESDSIGSELSPRSPRMSKSEKKDKQDKKKDKKKGKKSDNDDNDNSQQTKIVSSPITSTSQENNTSPQSVKSLKAMWEAQATQ